MSRKGKDKAVDKGKELLDDSHIPETVTRRISGTIVLILYSLVALFLAVTYLWAALKPLPISLLGFLVVGFIFHASGLVVAIILLSVPRVVMEREDRVPLVCAPMVISVFIDVLAMILYSKELQLSTLYLVLFVALGSFQLVCYVGLSLVGITVVGEFFLLYEKVRKRKGLLLKVDSAGSSRSERSLVSEV